MARSGDRVPWLAVGLISAATLAYEVLLTRLFALVHWQHLVATVISLALLGYGASGTFLALTQALLVRHFTAAFLANAVLFSLGMPACFALAQAVPLDPQALAWEPWQLARLAAVYLLLAIPFFGAANCVGLALRRYGDRIPRLYGIDLIGAGGGVLAVVLMLTHLHPATALSVVTLLGLAGAAAAVFELRWRPVAALGAIAVLAALVVATGPVQLRPAAYKDLARSLSAAGAWVERELTGPLGVVDVVRNDQVPLRSAPGLSLLAPALPPEQRAVFVDGDGAGALVRTGAAGLPAYLDHLSAALPYAVLDRPRVLLIGAGSGEHVLLALAHEAAAVVALEPNPQLRALACREYSDFSPALCARPQVRWRTADARAYVSRTHGDFDLIQLAARNDLAGTDSQRTTYDLTVEAFADYLRRLAPGGLLAIDGPTRLPPRLSLRLVATARQALIAAGVTDPGRHVAMIRGWQRFSLLVSRDPLTAAHAAAVRRFARVRAFDLVWLPDLAADEANRVQRLARPYFHDGVAAVLAGDGAAAADYGFRIDPASDDRPFAYRFSRWRELLGELGGVVPAGGSRVDAGFRMGVATLVQAGVAAAVLILVPLAAVSRGRAARASGWRWRVPLYFLLIGFAFLFVEIAAIQRLQLFLGHPLYATAAVLASFLLFAGLGSQVAQRFRIGAERRQLQWIVAAIVAAGLVSVWGLPWLLRGLGGLSTGGRLFASLLALAPLAFGMGMPFAIALRAVATAAPDLVPWAWSVNGCASVVGAVAAPLVAMELGFSGLTLIGLAGYLALPVLLPRRQVETS